MMKFSLVIFGIALFSNLHALALRNAKECIDDLQKIGKYSIIYSFDNKPIRIGIFGEENPQNGTILLLNGRADYIEKYCDVIIALGEKSYRVIISDWRGQGYSVRLLPDPEKLHINNFDDYFKDLNMMARIMQTFPKPYYLIGYDLGANIGLRFIAKNPKFFEKSVFVSPLWELNANKINRNIPEYFTNIFGKDEYIFGNDKYITQNGHLDQNLETANKERLSRNQNLLEIDDKFIIKGMTFGWLNEAVKSFANLKKINQNNDIKNPMLILAGQNDSVVPNKIITDFMLNFTNATYYELPDARHDLFNEKEEIIQQVFDKTINFLSIP